MARHRADSPERATLAMQSGRSRLRGSVRTPDERPGSGVPPSKAATEGRLEGPGSSQCFRSLRNRQNRDSFRVADRTGLAAPEFRHLAVSGPDWTGTATSADLERIRPKVRGLDSIRIA